MIHLKTHLVMGPYTLTDIPHCKIRQFFLVHLLCGGATGLTSPYYPFEAEGPFYLPSPKTFSSPRLQFIKMAAPSVDLALEAYYMQVEGQGSDV